MEAMKRTTVFLQPSLRKRLAELAQRSGRPQAKIVRQALEQYLDQEPLPMPESIGTVSDPTMSGAKIREYRREWAARLEATKGRRE
jgi:Ribbon-helix-helix protein, copG family